jgi:hypothetical protein
MGWNSCRLPMAASGKRLICLTHNPLKLYRAGRSARSKVKPVVSLLGAASTPGYTLTPLRQRP